MLRFFVPIKATILLLLLSACTAKVPSNVVAEGAEAVVWPDYKDVTIPCNIAPMNFKITDQADEFITVVTGDASSFIAKGPNVSFPLKRWRRLTEENKGGALTVTVYEKISEESVWKRMRPFRIEISSDPVDEFISYRLIDPTYGMAGEMRLEQRRLTDFRERDIFSNMLDYDRRGGQCVNCHSFQNWGTSNMQFHVRQRHGGTIIVHDDKVRKVNLKRDGILSAGVYPSWHPTEDLIAYSVNSTYQLFYSKGARRAEVLDSDSDLILYDVEADKVTPVLTDSLYLDTFPYWSLDGKTLYFCRASLEGIAKAAGGRITDDYKKVLYNLMRMDFDPRTRSFSEPEIVFDAATKGYSATFPRLSPDGKHLLFTLGSFGTFHIWHKDSDLYMINIGSDGRPVSGEPYPMETINSDDTESYHSWSSNGKWIVFSSRRDDGLYTRLYLTYFDKDGKASKPFIIPQKNPEKYLELYKSYNIPEFTTEPVKQTAKEFLKIVRNPS